MKSKKCSDFALKHVGPSLLAPGSQSIFWSLSGQKEPKQLKALFISQALPDANASVIQVQPEGKMLIL